MSDINEPEFEGLGDEEGDYELPVYDGPGYSAEELERKIARAEYEYSFANDKLRTIEVAKTIREKKTKVILSSRRFEFIQNQALRAHLIEIFQVDPKFKWTKEVYESIIHIEHQEIFDAYYFYEKMANQAKEDYKMLSILLTWKMSKIKQDIAERGNAGRLN